MSVEKNKKNKPVPSGEKFFMDINSTDNIKFFMGEVTQTLKNHGNIMKEIKENQLYMFDTIREISTSIKVQETNFENHINKCTNRFNHIEENIEKVNDCLDRDYKRINDIEKRVAIENGANRKSKNYIMWLIGIFVSLITIIGFYNSIKKGDFVLTDKEKKILIKILNANK